MKLASNLLLDPTFNAAAQNEVRETIIWELQLPIEEMIRATKDEHFISRMSLYKKRLRATLDEGF
jgi:hypothetical protein